MRALVTGGGGFIGSHISERLLTEGWDVRILDNFSTGERARIPKEAELQEGDLANPDDLKRACGGVDVVFHQAAIRSVPKSVDDPRTTNDANVTGTLNLLMAAKETGVEKLIYASSSSVYGDRDGGPASEDLAPDPLSPYAASKLAGEYYCKIWTRLNGLPTVSLRYFNVFGPGQNPESKYSAVFPAFISALIQGQAPEVHWDGEQTRDFTYIEDVVEANLAAATASATANGEVFNVGSGSPKSVNDVLKAISGALGVWIEPTHSPRRTGDVRATHAKISKAEEILGWSPAAPWQTSVQSTVHSFTRQSP